MGRAQRWTVIALAGALGACSGSSDDEPGTMMGNANADGPSGPQAPEPNGKPSNGSNAKPSSGKPNTSGGKTLDVVPTPTGKVAAALVRVSDCTDLLTKIHEDMAAKVAMQAELMRKEPEQNGPGGGVFVTEGGRNAAGSAATPLPVAPPGAPSPGFQAPAADPSVASDSSKGSGPTDFSDTNVQVKGVDEADIVKTDGEHLYVLHGNHLFVVDSWPADTTSVRNQIEIEGSVQEMFVSDGKAVVFSSIWDHGDLIPRPQDDEKAAADAPIAKPGRPIVSHPNFSASFTKVTVVTVGESRPEVERQLYLQGDYVSARRHDNTVRTVIRDGSRFPNLSGGYIEYRDQWGRPYPQEDIDAQVDVWRDRTIAALENTELADWLPVERELKDGKLTPAEPRCGDFYTPTAGLSNGGITNIVSFDLSNADSELGGATVLGMADEVYANDATLVLAHRDWRWDQRLIERERTVLHRFELKGADTAYSASGAVTGHILDQFSIDEHKGVIRVATSTRFWQDFVPRLPAVADAADEDDIAKKDPDGAARRQTDNRVITLGVDGDSLKTLGMTKPLGKDGEVIYSSRFIDERGYVVTFERIDPLIVVDLAKPETPTVLGQLNIPGFSEYMHPLGNGHLLTIGQDADTNGRVTGLMLQIFDVTDATKPRRVQSFRFGPNGYSEASANHKAFTFHKPSDARGYDGLLAFPYVDYSQQFSSTLQVFEVSIARGFTQLGAIDHSDVLRQVCVQPGGRPGPQPVPPVDVVDPGFGFCVSPEVRRGVFIFGEEDDFVYSISHGGVLVNSLDEIERAVATVRLPAPDHSEHPNPVARPIAASNSGSVTVAGGGTAGSAGGAPPIPVPPPAPTPQP